MDFRFSAEFPENKPHPRTPVGKGFPHHRGKLAAFLQLFLEENVSTKLLNSDGCGKAATFLQHFHGKGAAQMCPYSLPESKVNDKKRTTEKKIYLLV